jgi:hypothetical protein
VDRVQEIERRVTADQWVRVIGHDSMMPRLPAASPAKQR